MAKPEIPVHDSKKDRRPLAAIVLVGVIAIILASNPDILVQPNPTSSPLPTSTSEVQQSEFEPVANGTKDKVLVMIDGMQTTKEATFNEIDVDISLENPSHIHGTVVKKSGVKNEPNKYFLQVTLPNGEIQRRPLLYSSGEFSWFLPEK